MFSKPYFYNLVRSNYKLFIMITMVLCVLISIIMSVFTPETLATINQSSADLPINPLGDISTLLAFISKQYFGMMALIFPMIFLIIVGNRIIAGKVDSGTLAYELSTQVTRLQITLTSTIFIVASLTLMFTVIAGVGVSVAEIVQPGELNIGEFFTLTLGAFLLQLAIGSIVFCASCIFNRTNKSLMFGAGIPIFFFATNLLAGMSDKLEFFKYTSLITLFDKTGIINGDDNYILKLVVLGTLSAILFTIGIIRFNQKDLPL